MTGRRCAGEAVSKRPCRKRSGYGDDRDRSRLKLDLPIRYRVKNLGTWYDGNVENISQSGVLFHGPQQLPTNAMVEMVFEMPEEISGQKNSNVLCQGRLIRSKQGHNTEDSFGLAASILDYKFLHQD